MQAIVVTITTFPESADTSKTIFLAFSLGLKYGIHCQMWRPNALWL